MRTKDYNAVYDILSSGDCFWSAKDDHIDLITLPAYISRLINNKNCYLLMPDEGTLFLSWPLTSVCYEIHTAILKKKRKKGIANAIKAGNWLVENTPCKKLMTYIPEKNELAKMFCYRCGMKQEGYLTKAMQKDGELVNLVIFGICKGE